MENFVEHVCRAFSSGGERRVQRTCIVLIPKSLETRSIKYRDNQDAPARGRLLFQHLSGFFCRQRTTNNHFSRRPRSLVLLLPPLVLSMPWVTKSVLFLAAVIAFEQNYTTEAFLLQHQSTINHHSSHHHNHGATAATTAMASAASSSSLHQPSSGNLLQHHHQQQQQERVTLAQVKKAAGSQSLQSLQEACRGWTTAELDNSDVNVTTKTPLHMAAWKGCLENVQYLIEEMHCDVNIYSKGEYSYGKTAIFFAATQSRVDVIQYLLSREAKVTIVNNKGQSVVSIASSHDMPPTVIERIQELERQQGDWWNFRASHSDHLEYGDLDPRFFTERPLRESDVVTPLALNPTTKATRKGGFARRNPEIYKERKQKQQENQEKKQDKAKGKKNPNKFPGFTPTQLQEWDQLWAELATKAVTLEETANEVVPNESATLMMKIVRLGNHYRLPWIPETAERLLALYNNDAGKVDSILTQTQKLPDILPRDVELLQKIQLRILFGNETETDVTETDVSTRTTNNDSLSKRGQNIIPVKQQEAWKMASSLVQHLSIEELEDNWRSNSEGVKNLTLPYPPLFVDTIGDLTALWEQLRIRLASTKSSNESFLIAVDSEWYDVLDGDSTSALSTMQIAFCDDCGTTKDADIRPENSTENQIRTFVVDLTIRDPEYHETAQEVVRWILHTPNLLVLGFALSHDVHMLEEFGKESLSTDPNLLESTFLDLQMLFARNGRGELPGLKSCAAKISTVPLSKAEQCSPWGERPLRQSQLDYAGLDAAILLVLLSEDHRRRQTDPKDFNAILSKTCSISCSEMPFP